MMKLGKKIVIWMIENEKSLLFNLMKIWAKVSAINRLNFFKTCTAVFYFKIIVKISDKFPIDI